MIKVLLMDVGKTILTNNSFDFGKGLKAVYDCSLNKELISFNEYINLCWKIERDYPEFDFIRVRGSSKELPLVKLIRFLNEKSGLLFDKTIDELEDIYLEAATVEDVIDNVIEFLKYVNEIGIKVYAVSNSCFSGRAINKQISIFGVDMYLTGLKTSADLLTRKPYKSIFLESVKIAQEICPNVSLDEIAYLGNDYKIDMLGAHSIGLKAIWINHNNLKDDLRICYINENNYLDMIKAFKKIVNE